MSPSRHRVTRAVNGRASPRPIPAHGQDPGAPRVHDEQSHALLCERIARINDEQQSRWRKILGLIPGSLQGKITL